MVRVVVVCTLALILAAPSGITFAQDNEPAPVREIDACGTLVRSGNCFLVEVAGGRFLVTETGRFRAGDEVRVIGTLDESCITICADADGCIRGAELFDPEVLPCGTPIGVPFDPCAGLSAALTMFSVVGLYLSRQPGPSRKTRRRAPPTEPEALARVSVATAQRMRNPR